MIDSPNQQSYVYLALLGQFRSPIELGAFDLHFGPGVPAATLGKNTDYYLRSDGAAGANTCLYHKEGGAWVGLTA